MFNESGGRVLVAIENRDLDDFVKTAAARGVIAKVIGETGGSSLQFGPMVEVSLESLTAASENQLPEALGQGTVNA